MRNLNRELLHGNSETLVLAQLAKGASYGYQMRKDLAVCSRHYFQFAFGSLYPLLRTLEKRGLVRARLVKPVKLRERRQYAITAKGRSELQERKRQWRQFSNAMERVLSQT
jgi:DNA-binding PadR family transcriptional regulator